ncbi:hypothetical protein ACJX0J_037108, partial [Zea mays]
MVFFYKSQLTCNFNLFTLGIYLCFSFTAFSRSFCFQACQYLDKFLLLSVFWLAILSQQMGGLIDAIASKRENLLGGYKLPLFGHDFLEENNNCEQAEISEVEVEFERYKQTSAHNGLEIFHIRFLDILSQFICFEVSVSVAFPREIFLFQFSANLHDNELDHVLFAVKIGWRLENLCWHTTLFEGMFHILVSLLLLALSSLSVCMSAAEGDETFPQILISTHLGVDVMSIYNGIIDVENFHLLHVMTFLFCLLEISKL